MLASQQVDLGLVLFPSGSPSVDCAEIGHCRLVCVVDRSHKFCGKKSLFPVDLAQDSLICYDEHQPLGRLIEGAFHKSGVSLRISINVELCTTACSLARYSGKIAIVDEFTASAFPDLVSIPFQPEISVPISLLTPTHRPSSLIAEEFVAQLKESLQPSRPNPSGLSNRARRPNELR
jgi:DNA-binding transcriptional LysR family regulator